MKYFIYKAKVKTNLKGKEMKRIIVLASIVILVSCGLFDEENKAIMGFDIEYTEHTGESDNVDLHIFANINYELKSFNIHPDFEINWYINNQMLSEHSQTIIFNKLEAGEYEVVLEILYRGKTYRDIEKFIVDEVEYYNKSDVLLNLDNITDINLVADNNIIGISSNKGLYISSDGGKSWKNDDNLDDLTTNEIKDIVIMEESNELSIFVVINNKIYKCDNIDIMTFTELSFPNNSIHKIYTSNERLFVTVESLTNFGYEDVYYSDDLGINFSKINYDYFDCIDDLIRDDDINILFSRYDKIFYSDDNLGNFIVKNVSEYVGNSNVNISCVTNNKIIYHNDDYSKLYISKDLGANWDIFWDDEDMGFSHVYYDNLANKYFFYGTRCFLIGTSVDNYIRLHPPMNKGFTSIEQVASNDQFLVFINYEKDVFTLKK